MPLVYQQNINEDLRLGLWHISETEAFFEERTSLQSGITHPHKRLQHLAGRHLLPSLFPGFPLDLVKVADTRKPYLYGDLYHFSISHCGDYAAAIVSTYSRVGVDFEIPQSKIVAISRKFISREEAQFLGSLPFDDADRCTIAWSVKEAIFKWYGEGNMDFKNDMQICHTEVEPDGLICTYVRFIKSVSLILHVSTRKVESGFLSWISS